MGIAFGTITCLKIGYMASKKRIGQTCCEKSAQQETTTILIWSIRLVESYLSAGSNESGDASVTDKHFFSVSYQNSLRYK
jgi:hypothetical protein